MATVQRATRSRAPDAGPKIELGHPEQEGGEGVAIRYRPPGGERDFLSEKVRF